VELANDRAAMDQTTKNTENNKGKKKKVLRTPSLILCGIC